MRKNNMNSYLPVLSSVLQGTEDEANDMNDDFEVVRQALEDGAVADLGSERLAAIKAHFQKGTDGYTDKLNQLQQASAPVRILGKHKTLVAAFRNYTEGCQAMTDSINAEAATVDEAAFNAAEKTQENAMEKVTSMMQRIMTSPM